MKSILERIESHHEVLLGKPVIKGTRIAVELILLKLSQGANQKEITIMYPQLTQEDVNAAIYYAFAVLSGNDSVDFAA